MIHVPLFICDLIKISLPGDNKFYRLCLHFTDAEAVLITLFSLILNDLLIKMRMEKTIFRGIFFFLDKKFLCSPM